MRIRYDELKVNDAVTFHGANVRKALKNLNKRQLHYLGTISALIEGARTNSLKEELERNSGKLRGFLDCLWQMEVITGAEEKTLYLWFFEADRKQ